MFLKIIKAWLWMIWGIALAGGCKTSRSPTPLVSSLSTRGVATGQYRGFVDINQTLLDVVFLNDVNTEVNSSTFRLWKVFGSEYFALDEAVGKFIAGKYSNADPNAFNMYLWTAAFNRLAMELAGICDAIPSQFTLRPTFEALVQNLCQSPHSLPPAFDDIWYGLVGFESATELMTFKTELAELGILGLTNNKQRVHSILYALFLNPHFLLES